MLPKVINSKLLETIPEIKELFEKVTSWQDGLDTGSTIVIEDVFMVYLKECIKHSIEIEIEKCSMFLEWLSDFIDDEYAGDVVVVSVFEYIHFASDKTELEKVLGPKAKEKYNSIKWDR